MKLEKIQDDLISAIFNIDQDSALKHIESDHRLDAAQRLGIYRGSIHGILTQFLANTFPVCKSLLGEEFFDKLCDRFIDKHPPSSPYFSNYGDKLSLFLGDFDPVKTIPYICDVAEFEWSRHRLSQQVTAESTDFSQISSLTDEQQTRVVFHLSNTLYLFHSSYRVDLIWFAHQENSNIKLEEIDINSEVRCLLWKDKSSIKINTLDTKNAKTESNPIIDMEYWNFLSAISKSLNVTDLAIKFGDKFPDLLNKCIQSGWIESFTCD